MENGPALLLLSPPPSILSPANTKAAYGPAFDSTLSHISRTNNPRLDVAIELPSSWLETQEVSRTSLFERAQRALAQTYSLICATAANQQIELDCLDGLDARVFFLFPVLGSASQLKSQRDDKRQFAGPIVEISTLLESQRAYKTLFGVESEEGERLLKAFLLLCEPNNRQRPICQRVPGGLSIKDPSDASGSTATLSRSHTSVAVGGTFDHLHTGHKLLLTATALLAEPKGSPRNPSQMVRLTVGISGDDLLTTKRFAEEMESWDERQQKVADFLESIIVFSVPANSSRKVEHISEPGPNGKCVRVTFHSSIEIDYVEISDPFGPTITDESISALVLSQETRSGGSAVNDKRQEKGWTPLEVFEIDVLEANPGDDEQDNSNPASAAFRSKISSTEIRRRINEKRNAAR